MTEYVNSTISHLISPRNEKDLRRSLAPADKRRGIKILEMVSNPFVVC